MSTTITESLVRLQPYLGSEVQLDLMVSDGQAVNLRRYAGLLLDADQTVITIETDRGEDQISVNKIVRIVNVRSAVADCALILGDANSEL